MAKVTAYSVSQRPSKEQKGLPGLLSEPRTSARGSCPRSLTLAALILMNELWPGICAAAALIALLVLIIRYHVHAFIALLIVSLGLGLAAGLPPGKVVDSINKGIADILREVLLLLALGAILGRMLETSGAAELIARR